MPISFDSRELGIFNIGGVGKVHVADKSFDLSYKEALYLGAGDREVYFESEDAQIPPNSISIRQRLIVIILTEKLRSRMQL